MATATDVGRPESLLALCAREFATDEVAELRAAGNTPTQCVRPGPQDGAMVDDHS